VVTVALGCGNHATAPGPAPVAPVAPVAQVAQVDDGTSAEAGPTDDECDALITHALDLQTPGDAGLESADRKQLTGEVRDRVLTRCRAMPRVAYRCAIAATTTDAFMGCDR
jgi:hypothetical protein